jgi:hypothetical protein
MAARVGISFRFTARTVAVAIVFDAIAGFLKISQISPRISTFSKVFPCFGFTGGA